MLVDPRLNRVAVSAVLLLAVTRTANAEGGAAETLFRQGRQAIVQGATEKGCALLAESDRLEPSPGAKLGLGLCEEQLGHYARAWVLLQKVIQSVPSTDERSLVAVRHAEEIAPKVAFVTVEIEGPRATGTRISTDIAELTTADLGVALAFDPGSHFFQISAPGHEPRRVTLSLRPGVHERVELSLKPPVVAHAPHPPAETPPGAVAPRFEPRPTSPLRSAGFVLEGTAAALLATSLVTGAFALHEKNEMNDACRDGGCSDAGLRAAARGDVLATISTATFIGALASGGVGALFLILGRTPKAGASASGWGPDLRLHF
jgi:hypothetical protein